MWNRICQAFTFSVMVATIVGLMSSVAWAVIAFNDTKPPFGKYYLTIENKDAIQGGDYWARWNMERLRGDCRIGYVTLFYDSEGKEFVLDRKPMGPPSSVKPHPGEVKSYARKYTVPKDASLGAASMTSHIQWVCNDLRHSLGLIDFGQYNVATIQIIPQK